MNLLKKLKQRKSALYASLFAVICVGTPHIVPVVAQFSQFKSMWFSIPHALAYAIALEIGIVFFALRSKMIQTVIFAIIATTLYLGYYDADIPYWTIAPIMPLIIVSSLPIMVVLIAHETGKKRKKRNGIVSQNIFDIPEKLNKTPEQQNSIMYFDHDKNTIRSTANEKDVHVEIGIENGLDVRPKNLKPIPEEIRKRILQLIDEGNTYRDIAIKTHTSISTISRVKNDQNEQNETEAGKVNET